MLALLDPTVTLTDVSSLGVPEVELVTIEHFVENICTCECSINSAYGRFYISSDGVPTLLLTTKDGIHIPWGSVLMDALTVHELTHFVQYKHRQWGGLHSGSLLILSDEETEEIRIKNERHAYENQTKYLEFYGGPKINVEEQIEWSVAMGSGGCEDNGEDDLAGRSD